MFEQFAPAHSLAARRPTFSLMGRLGRIMERKPKRYTANQAIAAIFGFDGESVFYLYDEDGDIADEYGFSGIPAKAYDELIDSYQRDEENCRIGLCGWWWDNPFNYCSNREAKFPKNAFRAWWNEKPRGIAKIPKWLTENYEWEEKQSDVASAITEHPIIPPWEMELETADAEKQIAESEKRSAGTPTADKPSKQVIAEGLTVADIQALTDKSNPRYRKELHAALCVWASFEHSPVPEGFTPKNEVGIRLADWENDHQMDLLESERKRIRVMVNWDKEGNKQRPKTK